MSQREPVMDLDAAIVLEAVTLFGDQHVSVIWEIFPYRPLGARDFSTLGALFERETSRFLDLRTL